MEENSNKDEKKILAVVRAWITPILIGLLGFGLSQIYADQKATNDEILDRLYSIDVELGKRGVRIQTLESRVIKLESTVDKLAGSKD